MRPLPIRLRLTLWYFVMFATAALVLSFTSWWMLRHALYATARQDLQERTDDIRMQLQELGTASSPDAMQAYFDETYRDRDEGKWLQILDDNHRWIYRSPRMAALNLAPQQAPKVASITEFKQGTRFVRMLAVTVPVNHRSYSIETGMAMNKSRVLLQDFGLSLLLLTPAVLFAAAAGGHLLSRKALSPVAAITRDARRITDKNLDLRLSVSATNDELSQLSLTLNHMLARIDVAFRSVRDFTANASHELRTPLARIRTEVEIALYRRREPEEYRQALEHVHQDVLDASGLLENLLTLARAEARSDGPRLAPIHLAPLLHLVRNEWEPIADHLGIHLDVEEVADDAGDVGAEPMMVLADRLSILQLLRILLDNACKYTGPGGTVVVSATVSKDLVLLAVEDSGIGIAPEHQDRVFERFYRVNGDTNRTGRERV